MFQKMLLILVIAGACLGAMVIPISACSPSDTATQRSLEDQINQADVVFSGQVLGGKERAYTPNLSVVDVRVEAYYQGAGPDIVTIAGFGDGPDCLSFVRRGDRWIFLALGDPNEDLQAAYAIPQGAVLSLDHDAEVFAITEQRLQPYPLPLQRQILYWSRQYGTVVAYSMAALLLAVVGYGWARSRQPASKAKRGS